MRRREEMASPNILDLVQNARAGNLKSFNELVLIYQDMAYNIAYRMLNDQRAAGTATQKAFLSAYRSLSTFYGGSFRAWLLCILIQACHDELCFHKSHSSTSIIKRYFVGMEGLKLDNKVQLLLSCLSPDDRVILVMIDVWGMDYAEVAEVTGRPTGAIRSRVALARKSLHD